jgi:hypothetical protein
MDVARALLERDLEALVERDLNRLFGFARRYDLSSWIFHVQLNRIAAGTARSPSAHARVPQMCVRRPWCAPGSSA